MPAEVSKPQSVPAMTRRGSPTDAATRVEPVGDDLGVLDVVARRVDHAGDEHHAVGQRAPREAAVLVGVAGVGHRQHERADVRLVQQRQDLVERDVVGVRALVVAPAHVQPDPRRVDARRARR